MRKPLDCWYALEECGPIFWACSNCGAPFCELHAFAPGEDKPSCPVCAQKRDEDEDE